MFTPITALKKWRAEESDRPIFLCYKSASDSTLYSWVAFKVARILKSAFTTQQEVTKVHLGVWNTVLRFVNGEILQDFFFLLEKN